MAAYRAVTAAQSIELAAFCVRVPGSGPIVAPTSIKPRSVVRVIPATSISGPTVASTCVPTSMSGPTAASINNNNLITSVFGPTVAPIPRGQVVLGAIPAALSSGPTIAPIGVAPVPAALVSGPTMASINNNIDSIAPGFGHTAAPLIHVPTPGSHVPLCNAVPAPASAASICNTVTRISISIPEVVDESSCPSPGPRFEGELQIWPLCLAPDWPISDNWRDFAFSTITLKPSADTPGESSADSEGR